MRCHLSLSLSLFVSIVAAGCASGPEVRAERRSQFVDAALPEGGLGLFVEASLANRRGEEETAVALLDARSRQTTS